MMLGLFSDILSTFPDESSVSVQEPNVTVNSYVFNKFSVIRIVFVITNYNAGKTYCFWHQAIELYLKLIGVCIKINNNI